MTTDTIIIRKANESDLADILSLINSPHADNGKQMELHDANAVYQSILDDPNYFQVVASSEHAIVGVITLVIVMQMTHEGSTTAFINDLIISNLSNEEQLHIAQELLTYALSLSREYGCYKIIMQGDYQQDITEASVKELGFKQNNNSFTL